MDKKLKEVPDMDRPISYEARQRMKRKKKEQDMHNNLDKGYESATKGYKHGGMVRGDGCAVKGKTKGRMR